MNPVSVSAPCEPVAPSTKTGNIVSSVLLFADTVNVSTLPVTSPVISPTNAVDVYLTRLLLLQHLY